MKITFLIMFVFLKGSMMNCNLCNLEGVCTLKKQGLIKLDEIFYKLLGVNMKLSQLKGEMSNLFKRNHGCVKAVVDGILIYKSEYFFEKSRIQNIFVGSPFTRVTVELQYNHVRELFRKLEELCKIENEIRLRFSQLNQLQRKIDSKLDEIYTTKYSVIINNTFYQADISEIICKLMQNEFEPMISTIE